MQYRGGGVAGLILLAPLVVGAGKAESETLCERDIVAFGQMVARIRAEPGAEVVSETSTLIALIEPARQIMWTLGKPGGPVDTAYICRRVVQENGRVSIKLTAQCYGRTPNCDGLIVQVLQEQSRATAPLRRP